MYKWNSILILILIFLSYIKCQILILPAEPQNFLYSVLNFLVTVFTLSLIGIGFIYCCHCIWTSNSDENDKLFLENFSKSELQLKIEKINTFLVELDENNPQENVKIFNNKCLVCFDSLTNVDNKQNGAFDNTNKEPLISGDIEKDLITLPLCEHTFHKCCIKDWWNKVGKTCPICSNKISDETIENTPRMRRKIVNIQKNLHPELTFLNIDYNKNIINYDTPSHLAFKD